MGENTKPPEIEAEYRVIRGPKPPREPIIKSWWGLFWLLVVVVIGTLSRLYYWGDWPFNG